ncbi:MAG: hypothetical protein R2932_01630 [Caldilineaceae bacterium]
MRIEVNHTATAQRYAQLADYYHAHVLHSDDFCCRHCVACKASYTSEAGHYAAGQLNAPGTHYDLTVAGKPLRIVVVGQESGAGVAHLDMAARRAAIACRGRTTLCCRARTPSAHAAYEGRTNVLRLLCWQRAGHRLCR